MTGAYRQAKFTINIREKFETVLENLRETIVGGSSEEENI